MTACLEAREKLMDLAWRVTKLETGLAFLIFFPFAAGLLAYLAGRADGKKEANARGQESGGRLRDLLVASFVVLEFIVMTIVSFSAMGNGAKPIPSLDIPGVCGLGLHFALDGFRCIYGCVAAFMWMMAAILSREYFVHHHHRGRFYLFLLWTLGATMGVFLSADLYTTFVFFEIMSFTSYVWVAQEENGPALRAAATYLAVAVTGGLVMLMGIFLLYHQLGTLTIQEPANRKTRSMPGQSASRKTRSTPQEPAYSSASAPRPGPSPCTSGCPRPIPWPLPPPPPCSPAS